MKRDAKRTGAAEVEAQVSAVEQVSSNDAAGAGSAARKSDDLDADWFSMTTGDPALYLKDSE
jgi:hypothetical protein